MSENQLHRRIRTGEFYEDCRYHPMLCVEADHDNDELVGISLITGDIGSCSPTYCGVEELTANQAIERRLTWNESVESLGAYDSSRYPRPT
jgi:hypothetical protein